MYVLCTLANVSDSANGTDYSGKLDLHNYNVSLCFKVVITCDWLQIQTAITTTVSFMLICTWSSVT